MEEGSFDNAVMGCEGVFHTAFPVLHPKSDPKSEVLDPAVSGTLNVQRSCKKNPMLKKVVLTSSVSAIARPPIAPKEPLDENSWTSAEQCEKLKLLNEFPKDLVSLKRAQVICFYLGRPEISLKLVEQVLPHNQDQSYIHGMLSFPLLELGRMAEAERAARKGYEINKYDPWSQHCLCHVFQYECRFKEAVDFMESCSCTWNFCSSFMFTHNWWHVAVCYLEGHSPMHKVLEIYDHHIWKDLQRSDAECGEVYVNALGLLLRIDVRGYRSCIEDRITVLANIFEDESMWHMEWLLDILALWALACKKESTKAEDLLKSMKSRFCMMSIKKQNSMQSGVKLAEAIYEYGRGNYHKAYDSLGPDFDATRYKMIGASDEQLDVFNEVWYDVLLNTKQISKVIEDIKKAVKKREGAPFLWRVLARAYAMQGAAEARVAAEKANTLESAYFK